MDVYARALAAAERVLQAEIKQYVPAMFQSRIPADLIHKSADEVSRAMVDDLKASGDIKS